MHALSQLLAVVGILTAGIIYGTDTLGALVGRPTWKQVDEHTLVMANGTMHYYGDRRFPIPGFLSVFTTVLAAVFAAVAGRGAATAVAAVAAVALLVWLAVYKKINAPINAILTKAAQEHRVPDNARELQDRWDSVIYLRASLQFVAVGALCVVLLLP